MREVASGEQDEDLLEKIQCEAFRFFVKHGHSTYGLVPDSTQPNSPCSIGVVGFGLSGYPIAVEHGWMTRAEARTRTLNALRFFHQADQSGTRDGVGYMGFFYHFLDMQTGKRARNSELSTIDSALLVAGMLTCARYFNHNDDSEKEIRDKAAAIYERMDWRWAQQGDYLVAMAWTPERGFLPSRWIGYSEALILYVLALGSPSYPIESASYAHWLSGYRWKRIYNLAHVYAGPLFIHQFSHLWIDFRRIRDGFMATKAIDYFENSRRATYVHYEYARRNPRRFRNYHDMCWGLTASDGPGPATQLLDGRQRTFYGYRARGAPFGPDDGTIAPWASLASLPFAPELVVPTLKYLINEAGYAQASFGFYASFNSNFRNENGDLGWASPWHYGLNQGPIVVMAENYRNGLIWRLMRECPPLIRGLRRAGFSGGWLNRT